MNAFYKYGEISNPYFGVDLSTPAYPPTKFDPKKIKEDMLRELGNVIKISEHYDFQTNTTTVRARMGKLGMQLSLANNYDIAENLIAQELAASILKIEVPCPDDNVSFICSSDNPPVVNNQDISIKTNRGKLRMSWEFLEDLLDKRPKNYEEANHTQISNDTFRQIDMDIDL